MTIHDLPILNASLNAIGAILLLVARRQIKLGHRDTHKKLMITAFCVSTVFLVSYVVYHANVGSVHFTGQGWVRPVYYLILFTHTVLAAAVPVLATITLIRGLKARYNKHVKIAKWTYPVWIYVNSTGVIVYLMLYVFFPSTI
jgi:uncharacterized membrane protein YozB (DUF420 family)